MTRTLLYRLTCLILGALLVSGCNTSKPYAASTAATQTGAEGAQSYAYDDDQVDYAVNGRRHVNALTAPANQVYYFAYDSSDFSDQDRRALQIQANYLVNHATAAVRLEGHTDARGSREYNIALGWRRAQAVQSLLLQQGVAASQIAVVSYGKERPAAVGDNEQAWSLNRRVALVYESK